jgi:hypothetical protein
MSNAKKKTKLAPLSDAALTAASGGKSASALLSEIKKDRAEVAKDRRELKKDSAALDRLDGKADGKFYGVGIGTITGVTGVHCGRRRG